MTYSCLSLDDPGRPIVFDDIFATPDGKAKLVPADIIPANERPDSEYQFVLITGRQLEHWHTGSMTRRAIVLDAIEPMATVSMNGEDMAQLGVSAGDAITIQSRRGEVGIPTPTSSQSQADLPVLIIGAGLAGLTVALHMAETQPVILMAKRGLNEVGNCLGSGWHRRCCRPRA